MLKRVKRLREVEKRRAAEHVAQSQGMHGKLMALQNRSGEIAARYSARRDAGTGDELGRQMGFTAGLESIRGQTEVETRHAGNALYAAMAHLRVAERRSDLTAETLSAQQREEKLRDESRETANLARKLKRPR